MLRFNELELGLLVLQDRGDPERCSPPTGRCCERASTGWCARRSACCAARSPGSTSPRAASSRWSTRARASPGLLFELALAADRIYMLALRRADEPASGRQSCSTIQRGPLPMVNGLTRLATRFPGDAAALARLRGELGRRYAASGALDAGLVTVAPDDLDWDDELRIAIEERAALSPDALTGMEASLRFAGPETLETQDLRPPLGLAELDLPPPQRHRRARRAHALRHRLQTALRLRASLITHVVHRLLRAHPQQRRSGLEPHAAARARAVAAELPQLVEGAWARAISRRTTSTCAPPSRSTPTAGPTSTT